MMMMMMMIKTKIMTNPINHCTMYNTNYAPYKNAQYISYRNIHLAKDGIPHVLDAEIPPESPHQNPDKSMA